MNKNLTETIAQWIRPEIRQLSPYHVPDPGEMIKLDAMENPYTWPEALKEEWCEIIREAELNRYPDPEARALCTQLRKAMAVPPTAEIMLGNGSDEIIQIILMAIAGRDRVVLSPTPGFVMYGMVATFNELQYVGVPLRDNFFLDRVAMLQAIETHQPAVVFLAWPNNPTGNLFDHADVCALIEAAPGLVVLDEAYHAFAGKSFMPMLREYDNLLVMRTVSKMGLAGLRLGLLAGAPAWLQEFNKVRLPYNINVLTQLSAGFALQHHALLDEQTSRICADRETLFRELSAIESLTVYPSAANFILFRVPQGQADRIYSGLKERGILIKNLNTADPALQDCLRVTVGTAEENAAFLAALHKVLA